MSYILFMLFKLFFQILFIWVVCLTAALLVVSSGRRQGSLVAMRRVAMRRVAMRRVAMRRK